MASIVADDFARAWDAPLVTLIRDSVHAQRLDTESRAFLQRAGLPTSLSYGSVHSPVHVSFAGLAHGPVPIADVLPPSIPESELWKDRVVLGEEWIDGGASPYWCLHAPSGRVEEIDLESKDERPQLANTSVGHLAQTFLSLRRWALRRGTMQDLRFALRDADPEAWPRSRWFMLFDYLESLDAADIICETDLTPRGGDER